ncbi:MAG TPA: hypothetical protein VJN89_13855 [Candidatus Acidoferrum sp.]|nr:hypothetical protein [Candidatus Acidoferrum sp.]
MRKSAIAFTLFATLLATCADASAQTTGSKAPAAASVPDLSTLNIEKILEPLQIPKTQTSSGETCFLQVVEEFLQLTPSQASELSQLLQARQVKLVPIVQTAQSLTQQLGNLLNTGANPAQVGVVVIQIHALQQQAAQAQQAFLTQFTAILTADQLQRMQAVQIAAHLQPILPAFQPIFLF